VATEKYKSLPTVRKSQQQAKLEAAQSSHRKGQRSQKTIYTKILPITKPIKITCTSKTEEAEPQKPTIQIQKTAPFIFYLGTL